MGAEDFGVFLIRAVVGGFFAAHGCQLLLGWFGGGGLSRTRERFHTMGFRPASLFAPLAAATELVSGVGVVLGLAWPIAPLLALGPMTVAVARVHWPRIWVTESGIEYPLVVATVMAGVGMLDVGRLSLDHAIGIDLPHRPVYWTVLAGVLAGAAAALVRSRVTTGLPTFRGRPAPSGESVPRR